MLTINDKQMIIVTTKTETFTFHKSTSGICGICIERYTKPFSKLPKDKITYVPEKGNLTPMLQEFGANSFSFEIQAENVNKYLKVQLNDGQLGIVPVLCELENEK